MITRANQREFLVLIAPRTHVTPLENRWNTSNKDVFGTVPAFSGTGIDVVPNLPKRPLPVIPAVCLGTYSTEHTFVTFFCLLPIFEIHKILHNKRPTVKIALIANLSYGLICGIWWSVDGNATWHLLNNHSPSSGSSRAQTRQKPDKNKKQRKGEHARKSAAEAKRYCCS